MAKEFAQGFYNSTQWKICRREYAKQQNYLCEMCMKKGIVKAGEIVHHITELTAYNINDPNITLNCDNLMYLCRECHADIHQHKQRRYFVREDGEVVISPYR